MNNTLFTNAFLIYRNVQTASYARRSDHGSATASVKNVLRAHTATHPVAYLASSVLVLLPTAKTNSLGHVPWDLTVLSYVTASLGKRNLPTLRPHLNTKTKIP